LAFWRIAQDWPDLFNIGEQELDFQELDSNETVNIHIGDPKDHASDALHCAVDDGPEDHTSDASQCAVADGPEDHTSDASQCAVADGSEDHTSDASQCAVADGCRNPRTPPEVHAHPPYPPVGNGLSGMIKDLLKNCKYVSHPAPRPPADVDQLVPDILRCRSCQGCLTEKILVTDKGHILDTEGVKKGSNPPYLLVIWLQFPITTLLLKFKIEK
jgi:hypothetical protein